MKVTVIAVGKIRDKWIRSGIDEYAGRLKRFVRLDVVEIPDEKTPDSMSDKDLKAAMDREGGKILARWPQGAWSIALDPGGEQIGSEGLARLIEKRAVSGSSHFLFIIGGSNGLAKAVLDKTDRRLSFGKNTFPHQLFRIMLLEQIYRALKIRAGETYHK